MIFHNITVAPTQEILKRPAGSFLRGGPVWPHWAFQVAARHCRGRIPLRWDDRPEDVGEPVETYDTGTWCGPICWHFGHTIADFGMRLAASAHLGPPGPLVFSIWEDPAMQPAAFFWPILDHLGIDRARVLLVRRPTRFRTLHVFPQAERMWGGGPSRAHLDLMDRITGHTLKAERDLPVLYVSRAGQAWGRMAAEGYLDDALTAAGVRVFHPEMHPLSEQVATYARARAIVFSEGSAVHTLQLLGRLGGEVNVLMRRPFARLAEASLRPRVARLRYLDALHGLVYGRKPSGHRHRSRGISVLREDAVIRRFRDVGVDLAPVWDPAAFRASRDADLAAWLARTRDEDRHPRSIETAEACLRRMAIRF